MGSGFKSFEVGEVLGAADVNGYLMKQTTMAFQNETARDAGILSPEEGMLTYLRDEDRVDCYMGDVWRPAVHAGEWYEYSPAWTSTGTQPNLGNGVANGRYMRQGMTIFFHAEIIMGSTTTYGTGQYDLLLPWTARTTSPTQYVQSRVSDSSAGQAYAGQSGALTDTFVRLQVQGAADLDNVAQGTPVTLASGDSLHAWGTYELAIT